jgi:hypothetical protein
MPKSSTYTFTSAHRLKSFLWFAFPEGCASHSTLYKPTFVGGEPPLCLSVYGLLFFVNSGGFLNDPSEPMKRKSLSTLPNPPLAWGQNTPF